MTDDKPQNIVVEAHVELPTRFTPIILNRFIVQLQMYIPEEMRERARVRLCDDNHNLLQVEYDRPETPTETANRIADQVRREMLDKAARLEQYEKLKAEFEGNRK